jgi:hypothetical protein
MGSKMTHQSRQNRRDRAPPVTSLVRHPVTKLREATRRFSIALTGCVAPRFPRASSRKADRDLYSCQSSGIGRCFSRFQVNRIADHARKYSFAMEPSIPSNSSIDRGDRFSSKRLRAVMFSYAFSHHLRKEDVRG